MNFKTKSFPFLLGVLFFMINNPASFGQMITSFQHMGSSLKLSEAKEMNFSMGRFRNYNSQFDGGFFSVNFPDEERISSNFQLSYSPINHLAISIHHSRQTQKSIYSSGIFSPTQVLINNGNQTGFDIGGYYAFKFQLRESKKRKSSTKAKYKKILFDIYSGYTFGSIKSSEIEDASVGFLQNSGSITINPQKIYIQSGIHYIGNYIQLSGIVRTGKRSYNKATLNGEVDRLIFEQINNVLETRTYTFLEYSTKIELNYAGLGVYGEMTNNFGADLREEDFPILSTINVGMVINIHEVVAFYKNKKQ